MKKSCCAFALFAALVASEAISTKPEAAQEPSAAPITTTARYPQVDNRKAKVWRTVVSPNQRLKMHRHDHARVVVALTDVKLKVIYQDKNKPPKTQRWEKGKAYWLEADPAGDLHSTINESNAPMEIVVIEFKQ